MTQLTVEELIEALNNQVVDYLSTSTIKVSQQVALDLLPHMDARGCVDMWINRDHLIFATSDVRFPQYYWGLEYVSDDHKNTVLDYVFFSTIDPEVDKIVQELYNAGVVNLRAPAN